MMTYIKTLSRWSALLLFSSTVMAQTAHIEWQRDQAKAPKSGAGEDFSYDTLSVKVPVHQWQGVGERLNAGVSISRTQFDWQGTSAVTDSYYALSIPLDYRQRRDSNTELVVKLEPGLVGVRSGLSNSHFNVNAEISGRFYTSSSSFWQVGALVDRQFGDAKAYPLLAYAWQPDGITEVELGFPYSQIQVMWRPEFSTYARLQPAGGLWLQDIQATADAGAGNDAGAGDDPAGDAGADAGADENPDAGADAPDAGEDAGDNANAEHSNGAGSDKLKYQSWQFATGAEFLWRNNVWLNAEAGYLFARNIHALDDSGQAVSARPANSLYWQLGLIWRY